MQHEGIGRVKAAERCCRWGLLGQSVQGKFAVLEPFYDFTRSVSKDQPCLPEIIGIMWGLDDLLDDVSKANSQFRDVSEIFDMLFKQE